MIAFLRGTLLDKQPNQLIVDVGGVGYDVSVPVSTFSAMPDTGREVKLHIHTHVREDAICLFGFATPEEKTLFEKLVTVSGIGPKLAVTVLSGLSVADLVAAIRSGEATRLVKVPGVGKKTAERIVLELRDKVEALAAGAAAAAGQPAATALSAVEQDVVSALVNLGCQRAAADAAVRKARATGTPEEFEPLFRRSLELVR
ncbi:MAG: Holliday junction branch migration protein RuvA [Bryobacteraceae bacterium]|nr:Holliday junction branch migration protein RuvA [Bryobacteraceae bacterium]